MPKDHVMYFHTGDWMKDPNLGLCSPSTRGIWIDAICAMHESDHSGFLEGTVEQLSRILRALPSEVQSAVDELQATGTASVTQRNKKVTLINRRMATEHKSIVMNRKRQRKFKSNTKVTHEVTQKSRSLPYSLNNHIIPIVPFHGPDDTPCTYCGATSEQVGFAHEIDHFIPLSAGGSDDPENLVVACHRCNQAKQGRIFNSISEAQDWLHHAYWESNRQRWNNHRKYAFDGKPPRDFNSDNGEIGGNEASRHAWKIFLESYPAHRRNKAKEAKVEFLQLNPSAIMLAKMLAALETAKASEEWQREGGKYVPGIEKWIGGQCWEGVVIADENELPVDPPGADPKPPKGFDWARDDTGAIIHPMRTIKLQRKV
jgi:5-methylcytosine-specific restriction endonuclease McrA